MSDLIKFDNPNYTIGAKDHCVAIRTNQLGKVMRLTKQDCKAFSGEESEAVTVFAAEGKFNG